jgi:hypothetical protein
MGASLCGTVRCLARGEFSGGETATLGQKCFRQCGSTERRDAIPRAAVGALCSTLEAPAKGFHATYQLGRGYDVADKRKKNTRDFVRTFHGYQKDHSRGPRPSC